MIAPEGTIFILRRTSLRSDSNYGIPDEDFGREMVMTDRMLPGGHSMPYPRQAARFIDRSASGSGEDGWWVLPDMVQPAGGPW